MKFNKSNIFLISLVSLFLLLSLSAVSASDADAVSDLGIADVNDLGNIDNAIDDSYSLSQDDESPVSEDPETNPDSGNVSERTPTSIESEDASYKYGDNLTFNIKVKDKEDNEISKISAENIKVSYKNDSEGAEFKNISFSLTESKIRLIFEENKTLPVGNYFIKIQFLNSTIEDKDYLESEKTVGLIIVQTETSINASDVKVKLGDEMIIPFTIKIESNKTLNVNNISLLHVFNGEDEIKISKVNGGIKLLNLSADVGEYNLKLKYDGNDNCIGDETTFKLTVLANNTIKANDTFKVNNHTKEVIINISIQNTNITTVEEDGKNKTNVNVTNLNITKEDLKLILNYYNGSDNVTEEITSFDLSGEDGNYTIKFTTDHLDNSTLTIIYKEGSLSESKKNVTLIGIINAKIVPVTVSADYQDGSFTFKLLDADTNEPLANTAVKVSGLYFHNFGSGLSISPSKEFTSDANGLIVIKNLNLHSTYDFGAVVYNFTALPVGKYNLTFKSVNDTLALENTSQITVNQAKVKIIASDYKQQVGSGVKYTFQLVNANTNNPIKLIPMQFKVKMGSNYTVYNATTNISGQYAFSINLIPGSYPVVISTNSANVAKTSSSKTINITKKPGVLTASNRTILFGSAPTAIIKFTDKKTGKAVANAVVKVRLYTSAKKYVDLAFLTNKTGHIKFSASLSVGKHKMIISSIDSNYSATSITRYVTVKKASGKFTASNLKTYYRSGKIFSIKLTNTKNKAKIYGGSVNIKVFISKNKFYNYTGTTDGNGKVNLKVSYKPGTYKVIISPNDKGYTAKSITRTIKVVKNPIKITPSSLKVKKGKYFKIKVTSKKNKKVLSAVKLKVKVYTGKKYKTYTIKTNKKGIASLKVTQSIGKHKIVISNVASKLYSAKALSRTLTVKK